ncbi:aminotransferase class V-fold PLP-dependent enzyme [Arachnia propionica]|uniref:Aminotransferase class V-fold PLP-dependent enzyme n=1 Tax=Arachnia propionica TaxID=1750 RepID=A0A3P1T3J4_9ACTN|nr:aminotransferase class V-fold PLP-dependent enzyme [Arachnia propionica]MDO5082381.1 aminotransferase class V-fold PLP-dependent enzyme [Arachnia propionica]RRD04041.1 aminotransferase class V-fold PLP-dependent enzyme [Arachnia propionica]
MQFSDEPPRVGAEVAWTLDASVRHLNHGSFGAVPRAVQEEQARLRHEMEANPVRWFASLPERVATARIEIAHILGVSTEQLALVPNASAGASAVHDSFLGRGAVDVMVTNHGYGAITAGACRLASRTGGRVDEVAIPMAASAPRVIELIGEQLERHRPGLLVIDQITSPTARALPVAEVCLLARDLGVSTLVDGAHAPGVLADPVCREADFWVGNLHKFACAPRGTAVLVARDGDRLHPVIDSWGAGLDYPERFDHLGTLDLTAWLVAPFAWHHLQEQVGWERIRQRSAALADAGVARLAEALEGIVADPVPDVGQPVGPMRLLRLPGALGATREQADALRIPFCETSRVALAFTSFEGRGHLRLSTHVYTTMDDFDHLARVGIPLLHRWAQQQVQGGQPPNRVHFEEEA